MTAYPGPDGGPLEPAILTTSVFSPTLYPFSPLAASCRMKAFIRHRHLGIHDCHSSVYATCHIALGTCSAQTLHTSLHKFNVGEFQSEQQTWAMLGAAMVTKP